MRYSWAMPNVSAIQVVSNSDDHHLSGLGAQVRLLTKFPHTAMAKPQGAAPTPGSSRHGGSAYQPLLMDELSPGTQRQASV